MVTIIDKNRKILNNPKIIICSFNESCTYFLILQQQIAVAASTKKNKHAKNKPVVKLDITALTYKEKKKPISYRNFFFLSFFLTASHFLVLISPRRRKLRGIQRLCKRSRERTSVYHGDCSRGCQYNRNGYACRVKRVFRSQHYTLPRLCRARRTCKSGLLSDKSSAAV